MGEHDQHLRRVVARGGEDACLLAARERPTLLRRVPGRRDKPRDVARHQPPQLGLLQRRRSVLCASWIVRGPLPAFNSSRMNRCTCTGLSLSSLIRPSAGPDAIAPPTRGCASTSPPGSSRAASRAPSPRGLLHRHPSRGARQAGLSRSRSRCRSLATTSVFVLAEILARRPRSSRGSRATQRCAVSSHVTEPSPFARRRSTWPSSRGRRDGRCTVEVRCRQRPIDMRDREGR